MPHAVEGVKFLKEQKKGRAFIPNTSSRTRLQTIARFNSFGYNDIAVSDVRKNV